MMTPRYLYAGGAELMLLDAFAYSFGALRPLHTGFAPRDRYLSKRLLLNLMLANAGAVFFRILCACRSVCRAAVSNGNRGHDCHNWGLCVFRRHHPSLNAPGLGTQRPARVGGARDSCWPDALNLSSARGCLLWWLLCSSY